MEYNVKTGQKECKVELLEIYPKHAVKRKDGHSDGDCPHRVCRVAADGLYRHCFGGKKGSGTEYLNCPVHVALREDNYRGLRRRGRQQKQGSPCAARRRARIC